MNGLQDSLSSVDAALASMGIKYCVIGGLAVSAQTRPRFTRDIDLAIQIPDDTSAEMIVNALLGQGYRLLMVLEQEVAHRLATVRLVSPGRHPEGVVVDLLFASSGIEPEVVSASQDLEIFPGLVLPIARPAHLLALKVLAADASRRPTDIADIYALLAVMGEPELNLAQDSLRLIQDRGFNRGKDLLGEFDTYRSNSPSQP